MNRDPAEQVARELVQEELKKLLQTYRDDAPVERAARIRTMVREEVSEYQRRARATNQPLLEDPAATEAHRPASCPAGPHCHGGSSRAARGGSVSGLTGVGLWPGLALVAFGLWMAHAGWAPTKGRKRGPSHLPLRAEDWLAQADLVGVRVRTIILVCLGSGLGGAAMGLLFGGWLLGGSVAAVVGGVAGFLGYPWWLRGRHARHRDQVRRALPEAIERVRDALSSGLTIDRAFDLVAREGPEVLQPVMTDFCESQAHLPFEVAVTDLQQRLADRDFDLVASALLLHNEVGGRQFRACLDQLATSLREMLAIRDRLADPRAEDERLGPVQRFALDLLRDPAVILPSAMSVGTTTLTWRCGGRSSAAMSSGRACWLRANQSPRPAVTSGTGRARPTGPRKSGRPCGSRSRPAPT